MMKTKNPVLYLPHELIIQILLRLPVKSLISFKCVCKSWYSLISDPHFANSQFQLTASTHTHRAFFISTVSPHESRSVDLEASIHDDSASVSISPNFVTSESYYHIAIKGSCRGFILFHCSSSLYLWNPSTGVHKNIPFGSNLDVDAEIFYGFGYDQSTDDYLMVSMSYDTDSPYLEFFSIRANTWKQIDLGTYIHHTNTIFDDPRVGLFFNGAIHWFAHCLDSQKNVIVAFDLMERKLLDMHFPDQFDGELDYCGLWVFREFLSLWAMNYSNDTVEIWVMKEYKLHSSWTKNHVLPSDTNSTLYFFPLHSTERGDIVGIDDSTILMKYNDDGQLLEHRSYDNDPSSSHVAMYTESLLSLPGDDVQDQEEERGYEIFSFIFFLIFIIILYYVLLGGCIRRLICV